MSRAVNCSRSLGDHTQLRRELAPARSAVNVTDVSIKTDRYVNRRTKLGSSLSWLAFAQELGQKLTADELLKGFFGYSGKCRAGPTVADRWVLVSSLHKAIRYGLVDQAAATAQTLFTSDPVYFYRRLPVIALEDVSLGNLPACAEVLTFCRDLPLRRKFQGLGLAGYLGARLAATHKSRSACDLISLVNAQHGQQRAEAEIASLSAEAAMDAASSQDAPLRARAVALLRLDRLPIRNGDQRREALRRVAERLNLPAVVAHILVDGNATHGLNAMLPLVFELMANRSLRIETVDFATEMLDGPILCAAADQYTRLGKEAMRRWFREASDLSGFLAQHDLIRNAGAIVGMTLFHIEGSILGSRLTNDCLELLRDETERAEMAQLGLSGEAADELYELMRRSLPALNEIRRLLWKAR